MRWRGAALWVLGALLSGCATRQDVARLHTEFVLVRAELGSLREVHEQHARETARLLGELGAIEPRVRQLAHAAADVSEGLRRLGERVDALEATVREFRAEVAARAATPPSPPPERPREAPRSDPAEAAYQAALDTFRAREHGQAVLELLDFLAKYPKHPLAPSAQYWIGEAYYLQHDYRQALAEFQKVLAYGGPDGPVAEALVKIGLCYARLREPMRAQEAWQRVVREFPDSEAAERARTLLRGGADARAR
jgi:tol-pal system protein YbgF